MVCLYFIVLFAPCVISAITADSKNAFDQELYRSVLNESQCYEQLTFLSSNSLGLQFLDASGKIPNGILTLNLADLGDYHQCLSIHHIVDNLEIRGKYCTIKVPLNQNPISISIPVTDTRISLPEITWSGLERDVMQRNVSSVSYNSSITLAVCIPRVCTSTQAINFFQNNSFFNVTFSEYYCRLPGDKPFAAADYVATVFFSLLALMLITSTSYDLYMVFVLERDSSETSTLYKSFSIYTNTRRLVTFKPTPGTLDCVEGIRAISMFWVIAGHTYSLVQLSFIHNLSDAVGWMTAFSSTWINAAPITVDTFFLLSGILCVYTTVAKVNRNQFIRSIPLFYLHRLLRMFPLLAAVVLLQASFFHHVADGPYWQNVAQATVNCREYWWSAFLHVQNYVNPVEMCLYQSWYLSVDVQLYLLCPVVLVWLFGPRLIAWFSLAIITTVSLIATSAYSFTYNFSATLSNPNRLQELMDYLKIYYYNTVTRASPFCVGMFFGYLLHLYRGKKIRMLKVHVTILWMMSFMMMAFCIFSIYPVVQIAHNAQIFDNFLNAYMRAIWAAAVGWVIFACVHGYGGPINWFLSLHTWKLPARLSYAMYLIHLPIILMGSGTWMNSHYFSDGETMYRYVADLGLSLMAACVLCITVDAPFSMLQKMLFVEVAVPLCKKPLQKESTEC